MGVRRGGGEEGEKRWISFYSQTHSALPLPSAASAAQNASQLSSCHLLL